VTNDEFEALVGRLEAQAKRDPAGYKTRVLMMALLGNAYLTVTVFLIAVLVALAAASVIWLKAAGAKLALVLGLFLWVVLKALWVKVPPPQGTEIAETDAPGLFAMIDELRRALRSPRFHRVLVTDDFNAGVVQAPRLGLFGWYRNYLLIGLPLMKALTVEQFRAVLAHEFGHLSRGHGRLSNWIYRQRLRWGRLMAVLEEKESRGMVLFRPFLRWYTPWFNAYSFPLARANEYEADATSARLASPGAAAEALTAVNVIGSYLNEKYWPQIYRKAEDVPQPAFSPFAVMGQEIAHGIDAESVAAWLTRAMTDTTTVADTHPSLADRLGALGEQPRIALPVAGAGADGLLEVSRERLEQAFDEQWRSRVSPSWQEQHAAVQQGRRRLAELDAKYASGAGLSPQEAYEHACLIEVHRRDADAALERFRELHARVPEDPVVLHELGVRLLARNDDSGCVLLERAMEIDESAIQSCCRAMRDFHWRNGRREDAHAWHSRLEESAELERAAAKERNEVRLDDKLERHDLDERALAELQRQLRVVQGLRKAYFVRKRVKYMPAHACYLLGFTTGGFLRPQRERRAAEVLRGIQTGVSFAGETLIINVEGGNYRFGRKLRWMRGSRIL
jgi:Zn-dependent protease with chaperone function